MSDYEYEVRQLICEAREMNALIVRQTSELASLRAALDADHQFDALNGVTAGTDR